MDTEGINVTPENLFQEHLCCIIRSRTPHPGVEAKRQWLRARLQEGHVFRKHRERAAIFIEYAPLESAWVPVTGENYFYLYCLWVASDYKGNGYGRTLMESCLADARAQGKSGICMLGAQKQKAWLSDQSFAKTFGFQIVDTTAQGYELLALSLDGTVPAFPPNAKEGRITAQEPTIYYSPQCPYVQQSLQKVQDYCAQNRIPVSLLPVDTLEKAKALPCVFNNYAVFYQGTFETVNLLDIAALQRLLRK